MLLFINVIILSKIMFETKYAYFREVAETRPYNVILFFKNVDSRSFSSTTGVGVNTGVVTYSTTAYKP